MITNDFQALNPKDLYPSPGAFLLGRDSGRFSIIKKNGAGYSVEVESRENPLRMICQTVGNPSAALKLLGFNLKKAIWIERAIELLK